MKIRIALLLLSMALYHSLWSQLCQGSLGDPIVNITFGAGSNPGPPISAAATTYQYRSDDCPGDGYYSVRNSTSLCFSNTWHTLRSDHTGNAGGYFMLVNASFEPGAFYVDTVDVLCNNTTYEFAAWIVNVLGNHRCSPAIQPNLTFQIERPDGTVLKSYDTGTIPLDGSPLWKQYGFYFTTPPDVSRVVLRIINNAPGGCGNDLALDDITFRPCGPLVSALLNGSNAMMEFCEGQTASLNLSSTVSAGFTSPYIQWQQKLDSGAWKDIPGANTLVLNQNILAGTTPGTYQYRLAVSKIENINKPNCRVNSNILTVVLHKNPVPSASYSGSLCEEHTVKLTAKNADQYLWTGPNGFTASASEITLTNIRTTQSGIYQVVATSAAGCIGKDSLSLLINPRPVASVGADSLWLCEGRAVTLISSGGGSYLWKPSTTLSSATVANPQASPKDSTKYMVVVGNSFACTDTAYVQVNVFKKPVADAGADQFMMQGDSVRLAGTAVGTDIRYSWSPPFFMNDAHILQPLVFPVQDFSYILQVVSNLGCGTMGDTVKVHVFTKVYVPNAFTPNGDGLNDTWNIPALRAYSDYEILVFNRYGQVVYQSKNIQKPWDGTLKGKAVPTGVYPYVISLKQPQIKLTGWVVVIR